LSGTALGDGQTKELASDAAARERNEKKSQVRTAADLKDADELAVVNCDEENLLGTRAGCHCLRVCEPEELGDALRAEVGCDVLIEDGLDEGTGGGLLAGTHESVLDL
jgi:hypothetical protein